MLCPCKIGGNVQQRFLTWLIALVSIAVCMLWVVVSYLPSVRAMLPTLTLTGVSPWLAWLGVIVLVAFVGIQLWLVYTTVNTVRAHQEQSSQLPFRLNLGAEFFWTALPIAMTSGIAWASYALWLNFKS